MTEAIPYPFALVWVRGHNLGQSVGACAHSSAVAEVASLMPRNRHVPTMSNKSGDRFGPSGCYVNCYGSSRLRAGASLSSLAE